MNAGRLRHRVTIQQLVQGVEDGIGGTIDVWQDIGTVWAKVTPLNSREALIAQQLKHDATHQVDLRFRNDIDATMRLVYRGRILNNISIRNRDELNKQIRLLCREVK